MKKLAAAILAIGLGGPVAGTILHKGPFGREFDKGVESVKQTYQNVKDSYSDYLERIVRKDGDNYKLVFVKDEINSSMDYELKCTPEALEAWKKYMHEKERQAGHKFSIKDFYDNTYPLNDLTQIRSVNELSLKEIVDAPNNDK